LLLQAIESVAVVDGDVINIDRQALRDELDSVSGFSGIIGTLNCDEFGDCGAAAITVIQNTDNVYANAVENVVFSYVPEG